MTAGQKCLCSSSIDVVLLKYCSDNNTTCKAGAGIVGNGGKWNQHVLLFQTTAI